jgi:hypothetical protein
MSDAVDVGDPLVWGKIALHVTCTVARHLEPRPSADVCFHLKCIKDGDVAFGTTLAQQPFSLSLLSIALSIIRSVGI